MRKHSLLYAGLGLVILVWVLNFIALTFYFYWTVGWYDYLMHFLGGLSIGVLAIWALKIENRSLKAFLVAFVSVMVVGVGWEIFEYLNGLTFSTESYKLDIAHDLIMDALGATTAYYGATSRSQ